MQGAWKNDIIHLHCGLYHSSGQPARVICEKTVPVGAGAVFSCLTEKCLIVNAMVEVGSVNAEENSGDRKKDRIPPI